MKLYIHRDISCDGEAEDVFLTFSGLVIPH